MNRREFLQLAGVSALSGASILSGCASVKLTGPLRLPLQLPAVGDAAHFSLRIAPVKLELSPKQIIQTIGYNGSSPGPLLRVRKASE